MTRTSVAEQHRTLRRVGRPNLFMAHGCWRVAGMQLLGGLEAVTWAHRRNHPDMSEAGAARLAQIRIALDASMSHSA